MKEPAQSIDTAVSAAEITPAPLDVVVVGAGISGINSAYRLRNMLGTDKFVLLERGPDIGGTWSYFKYPGLRSDSDLYSFGFSWHPWISDNPIATGPSILSYMKDAIKKHDLGRHIRLKHEVKTANWNTSSRLWEFLVEHEGKRVQFRSRFLILATGYYDYSSPLESPIPGMDGFKGKDIHAQFWPEDYDYSGKNIVIIGSGATAITLLPVLAEKAKHVTIVQRSPSYVLSLSNSSKESTQFLRLFMSDSVASQVNRFIFVLLAYVLYYFCRIFPNVSRMLIRAQAKYLLKGSADLDPHFSPRYNPWDQRLCLCPDADFFKAIRNGKASMVTGAIETVTEGGLLVRDTVVPPSPSVWSRAWSFLTGSKPAEPAVDQDVKAREIKADVIVRATGLKILLAGNLKPTVDNKAMPISERFLWNAIMLQDLPNMFYIIGYTNASWTLGADASTQAIVRLIKGRLDKTLTPRMSKEEEKEMKEVPMFDLASTYIQEGSRQFPRTGDKGPWKPKTNYFQDMAHAWWGDMAQGLAVE